MEYVDPRTGRPLRIDGDALVDATTGELRFPIIDGIPRFVNEDDDYATSFGWQWKRWDLLGSSEEARAEKSRLLAERTRFTEADLEGKTLLECGCGRGDDTLALARYPLSEIHSFDLSTAVEAAAAAVTDGRIRWAQASIYEIPFDDQAFDIVFCHRVLQHTPDPASALRSICRKVKPGGLLFAHAYRRSFVYMNLYKYKWRPLTKRMDRQRLARLLERYGERLHRVNEATEHSGRVVRMAVASVLPFERIDRYGDFSRDQLVELAKLVTFDALTPTFDRPMTARRMREIVYSEGVTIESIVDERWSPVLVRARRK